MEVQRSRRRVRANAEFPTNRWRPAGWSATDRVALGGSCWHCGRHAVHCATCRSEGNASTPRAASPVKARHRRHSGRRFSSLATHQMPGKYPPPTCAVEVHHTVKEARSALALSETPSHAWCGHAPPLKSVPTGGLERTSGEETGLAADMAAHSSGATKLITRDPPSVYPPTRPSFIGPNWAGEERRLRTNAAEWRGAPGCNHDLRRTARPNGPWRTG